MQAIQQIDGWPRLLAFALIYQEVLSKAGRLSEEDAKLLRERCCSLIGYALTASGTWREPPRGHSALYHLSTTLLHMHITLRECAAYRPTPGIPCSSNDTICIGIICERDGAISRGDETWVSHITPESKRQSMEWRHTNSPVGSQGQADDLNTQGYGNYAVWDRHGVLLVEFMQQGTTINAAAYCATLTKLGRCDTE
ncbi:mariner Mos1 transposase [Trichonephila clavipes]|nr:mariner Mos1 transposase [Trichonephila clavipes]